MNTKRLYVEHALHTGAGITLDGDNAHYVGRVLRARPGDTLMLFNGDGNQWQATIEALQRRSVSLAVGAQANAMPEPALRIVLWQALSRNEKMDLVIQKAVELGVAEIRPVIVERSVMQLDDARAGRRLAHWQGVAVSAAQQCGRCVVPAIRPPAALADVLDGHDAGELALFAAPGAKAGLAQSLAAVTAPVLRAHLLIGPEGGLTDAESALAVQHGFIACSAGPRTMRTETAAIALLGVMQYALGDLDGR